MLTEAKKKEITEILSISPLLLLNEVINDAEILDFCNDILPFSVGIEIESSGILIPKNLNTLYLLDSRLGADEQNFRIPNGYKGLLALELITNQLKYFLEDTLSGNHYHIDCTERFNEINKAITNSDILTYLDSWEYKGVYNRREIANNTKGRWINMRTGFKTAEIRIGELAYTYAGIYKRIVPLSNFIMNIRKENNLCYNVVFVDDFTVDDINKALNDALYIIKDVKIQEKNNIRRKYNQMKSFNHKPLNKLERIIKCY